MAIAWGRMLSDLAEYDEVVSAGYDYAMPVMDALDRIGSGTAGDLKARVRESGIPLKVCPVPLPDEIQVTQKGFNLYVWIEYLKDAVSRVVSLGCKTLVWNSGHARNLPVEGPTSSAKEQILQFLNLLGSIAVEYDLSVLVEPLGPERTNFLNTLDETAAFLEQVRRVNLGCLVSLRELDTIRCRPEDFRRFGAILGHVQMENPSVYRDPRQPCRKGDGQDYAGIVGPIRDAGFAGTIALPEDASCEHLKYCRRLWEG